MKSYYHLPKSCSFNVVITQVSCGVAHSAMLTNSGHLYMMGCNRFGQLGVQNKRTDDFVGTFRQSEETMRAPCLVDTLKQTFI
jgi:alpha-tubulin suppressor-like RCC1 family protein